MRVDTVRVRMYTRMCTSIGIMDAVVYEPRRCPAAAIVCTYHISNYNRDATKQSYRVNFDRILIGLRFELRFQPNDVTFGKLHISGITCNTNFL